MWWFFHIIFLRKVLDLRINTVSWCWTFTLKHTPHSYTIFKGLRDDTFPETKDSLHPSSLACEKIFSSLSGWSTPHWESIEGSYSPVRKLAKWRPRAVVQRRQEGWSLFLRQKLSQTSQKHWHFSESFVCPNHLDFNMHHVNLALINSRCWENTKEILSWSKKNLQSKHI